jgi:hypothetical protein
MMGRRVMAEPLFHTFRLEDHLPGDHPLRAVDALLDTAFVRRAMAPHYSPIGRPSVDPELMVRMLLVGYLGGVEPDELAQVLEAELGEGRRGVVTKIVDGEDAVLRLHFAADLVQPVLVLAEHRGGAGEHERRG